MIVAFSTSSPIASVAVLSAEGDVLAAASEHAPKGASGACVRHLELLLGRLGRQIGDTHLFLSDLGPGSFTGVKVGVTLAKTLGFACGAQVAGADAFDLIDPEETVVLPSKRGEFFVRVPGEAPRRTTELPRGVWKGFGPGIEPAVCPLAERFAAILGRLQPGPPEALLPNYLIEPSISIPKKPYTAPGSLGT